MNYILEARGIKKNGATDERIKSLSIDLMAKESLAIVGIQRGIIKSIRDILSGNSTFDSGELFINGLNSKYGKTKAHIGLVSTDYGLDPRFTVLENLNLYANYFSLDKSEYKKQKEHLLKEYNLESALEKLPCELSLIEILKILIIRATIPSPEIIIAEEPAGLSASSRRSYLDLLRQATKGRRALVYLTTHTINIESYFSRVAVFFQGEIVCEGPPDKLIEERVGQVVAIFSTKDRDKDYYIKKIKADHSYQIINNKIRLYLSNKMDLNEAMEFLPGENLIYRQSRLEDVLVKMQGPKALEEV